MHKRVKFWPVTASGIVGSAHYEVTIHGWLFTETGGTVAETIDLYVPTANPNGNPAAPSTGGLHIAQIKVPAGTTAAPWMEDCGLYFPDGVYASIAGGTLLGGFYIS